MISARIRVPARDGMAEGHSRFRFTAAERRVLRRKKPIQVSVWAERHRWLTQSVISGPWRNAVTPYLTGIMDAAVFPSVETVIICKAPQVGGTEAAHNFVGYTIDRAPGPVMYVYPDKGTAADNSKDRILPMLKDSPLMRTFLTGLDDDQAQLRIKLRHVIIYLAWSHSPTSLANKPCRYVIFDEVDKYPDTAGRKEADPISLGEKRIVTYRSSRKSKIWKLSTPTIEAGPIWVAFTEEAQARFDYWVRCPSCGKAQVMVFDRIRWPEDERDPGRIESERLARYLCDGCDACWDDGDRRRAVAAGEWRERDSGLELSAHLKAFQPAKIGFHIPSWVSPFVSLSSPAAAFLMAQQDKSGDKTKLKDFMNNHKAEPWVIYRTERDEAKVLRLCDDRPRGMVPGAGMVAALTAGVDTQKHGFWFEIRAWGWGMDQESWMIREGFVESFEALSRVLFSDTYTDADGKAYMVQLAVQDAMGGTQRQTMGIGTRTAEVYDFCRRHKGRILPFKGEYRMNQPFAYTSIEYYPGTKKLIPAGGIMLLRGNVTYYKNLLSNKLDVIGADPGAWHFHGELNEDYARHYTAEYVNEKGLWECASGKDNHLWDCGVYNLIAADIIGVKFWQRAQAAGATHEVKAKPANNPYTEGYQFF